MKPGRRLGIDFTPRDVIRYSASFMAGAALVLIGLFLSHVYEASKPALRIERHPGEMALVQGVSVVVQVYQERERSACADAHADRVMIHVAEGKNPDDGDFDAIEFLREGRVATSKPGKHIFRMFLTLPEPLPQLPGGHWYYQANIYNGCDWIKRMLGGEAPIPTPAVPVKIIGGAS